ncbi:MULTISPECIES: ACT domain-containing protein [unclassified Nonomuraea]|uniref:ACT domain-containing protein n=1 Tax=Nonomuraea sp. NPDC003804 TaxID=3154547 RepID=UPI0033A2A7A3
MPTNITVVLDDRPGELARLGEVTGESGVNICGLAAFTGDGKGIVHVLVDDEDADRCRQALEAAGMGIADERTVLVVDVADRPGTLGELTRQLAEANVNIDLAYTTFGGVKLVVATDDLENARAALEWSADRPWAAGRAPEVPSIWDQPE